MATKAEIEKANAAIAATKKAELPKKMPVDKTMVTVVMIGNYNSLYHPYQRRWVPTADVCPEGVEMPIDSWLQSQIDAGLVRVV